MRALRADNGILQCVTGWESECTRCAGSNDSSDANRLVCLPALNAVQTLDATRGGLIDPVILWLGGTFIGGLLASFIMEAALRPRPVAPWRRPGASVGVHVGILLVAYGLELMLFRRPVFAMLNVLAIQAVIVLVSQAKFGALCEPFVYPDFEYFLDAIKHPRLYLPFFGRLKALAASGSYGLMLWAGLTVEDSLISAAGLWIASFADWIEEDTMSSAWGLAAFWAMAAGLVLFGAILTIWCGRDRASTRVTFDAGDDLRRLGLFTALWRYRVHETRAIRLPQANGFALNAGASLSSDAAPDIVVVQSESFFDARRSFPMIRRDVLAQFDALREQARVFGTLAVAAWGANTVRTEFAFLSGLKPDALGVHQFNPYRKLAAQGIPTLASYLRDKGYRTVCVHPYPASFYRRAQVYPLLGFEHFYDVEAFAGAERFGPYVSDAAVGEHVKRLIADRGADPRPLFVFVITMENHGPLHWETVDAEDEARFMKPEADALPAACSDLIAYVRHLKNADGMFQQLSDALSSSDRPARLCIYGDHVPIMPSVYASLGEPDGRTDFLLWDPGVARAPVSGQSGHAVHLHVSDLAGVLLRDQV